MKIKSIRKTSPELFRVIYNTWRGTRERYIVYSRDENKNRESGEPIWIEMFYYRDNGKLAHDEGPMLEWMIRNDVEYFNNFPGNGQVDFKR